MSKVVFHKFLEKLSDGTYPWKSTTTFKALLVKSTSTYSPNVDHATLKDLFDNGLVEITVSGYARATLSDVTTYRNTTADLIEFRCANLNFGEPAIGETVKGYVLYIHVDGTQNNDIPVAYDDTSTGLPMSTGGGTFVVSVPADGLFQLQAGT